MLACVAALTQHGGHAYSRDQFLPLRPLATSHLVSTFNTPTDIPRRCKRGRWGARLRRRPTRPSLPPIVFANVQSLKNKLDELHAVCLYDHVYRDSCAMAFCETWLDESVTDDIRLDVFMVFRSDRTR